MHSIVTQVTDTIKKRSSRTRGTYLSRMEQQRKEMAGGGARAKLPCSNFAHGFAANIGEEKERLRQGRSPNLAIVTAYNDMLSAHQPYHRYPPIIKLAAREMGGTAQVAGGVPAMCDGITQGMAGMEMSLFSRDVIALSTSIALSHAMFDGALYLGICDKIVPGLLIGALSFGHLPAAFVPSGPMPSGLSHEAKRKLRQDYAEGKADSNALLAAEAGAYHAPGTCTFYGTANSNQMLMEIMGLQLPGSSFVAPDTPLRDALTQHAVKQVMMHAMDSCLPLYEVLDERSFVNAVVGLLATGGSTNHTLHLVAMARAAGIIITWDDFAALSKAVPTVAKIYPSGSADVNQFHTAGGMAFVIRELLEAGVLHADVNTLAGPGLKRYTHSPRLDGKTVVWESTTKESGDASVLRSAAQPFSTEGGLAVLSGNLGRAVMKISALSESQWVIEGKARVFESQEAVATGYKTGELNRDVIVVLRFQGPRANGMPELHGLMPMLESLQSQGYAVALVTDGRLSGASGRVPAAIHVTPEAAVKSPLAKLRDGDTIRIDAKSGLLQAQVSAIAWQARKSEILPESMVHAWGTGRELFSRVREQVTGAEEGASFIV